MPIKAEQKAESIDVLKTVDEDRKYAIQATIVRYVFTTYMTLITPALTRGADVLYSIMKARKTVKNQQLIQEVISQISTRFTPKLPDIKKVRNTTLSIDLEDSQCVVNHNPLTGYRASSGEGVYRAGGRHQRHLRVPCVITSTSRTGSHLLLHLRYVSSAFSVIALSYQPPNELGVCSILRFSPIFIHSSLIIVYSGMTAI